MKRRMGVKRTRTMSMNEEDEVPEHERRRRRVLHATALRVKKLQALERKDPYSLLPVVHLTDLYNSPRFAHIDAAVTGSCIRSVYNCIRFVYKLCRDSEGRASRLRKLPESSQWHLIIICI